MTRPLPPATQLQLNVLASKLQLGLLDPNEIRALADFLRGIAGGKSLDELFGIKRQRGRPKSSVLEQQLFDMALMRLPVSLGGEGLSYKEMITTVARRYKKPSVTVTADYKSARGQEIRKEVKEIQESLALHGFGGKWLGNNIQELSSEDRKKFGL